MKQKSKVRQSTEKPVIDEIRIIDGIEKIWNGREWIKEYDTPKLNTAYNEVWNGKQG